MNQRYRRVYTLEENLYAEGAPVMIAAGTLLKDTVTDKIVAQMKFRSLSNKAILAVKVKLDLFDTAGISMGEPLRYEYLDLFATRNTEFGQKVPVHLPDNRVRMYRACVTEVVFADRSVWTATDAPWEPLGKPSFLAIRDPELFNRYRQRFGQGANYVVKEEKDLWMCTCGQWNRRGEDCLICQNTLVDLLSVDLGEWITEKIARLEAQRLQELARKEAEERAAAEKEAAEREAAERAAAEQAAAERAAAERAAAEKEAAEQAVAQRAAAEKAAADEKKEKKKAAATARKRKLRNFFIFLVIAGVIAALIYFSDIPLVNSYDSAMNLMEEGKYDTAITIFENLDDCDDREERIGECLAGIINEEPGCVTQVLDLTSSCQSHQVALYDVNLQLLDNGYALFTIKFKAEEDHKIVFQPGYFNYYFSEKTTGAPQVLYYPVKADTLQDMPVELTLAIGPFERYITIPFPYAYNTTTQTIQQRDPYDFAVLLMKAGRYEEAIPYLEEALPDHDDADDFIAQCLLAASQEDPGFTLQEKALTADTYGDVTFYDATMQLMRNGYVLFSIDLEAKPGRDVSFFTPPNGEVFKCVTRNATTGQRETLHFAVKAEDLESVDITIKLFNYNSTDPDDAEWISLDPPFTFND